MREQYQAKVFWTLVK